MEINYLFILWSSLGLIIWILVGYPVSFLLAKLNIQLQNNGYLSIVPFCSAMACFWLAFAFDMAVLFLNATASEIGGILQWLFFDALHYSLYQGPASYNIVQFTLVAMLGPLLVFTLDLFYLLLSKSLLGLPLFFLQVLCAPLLIVFQLYRLLSWLLKTPKYSGSMFHHLNSPAEFVSIEKK